MAVSVRNSIEPIGSKLPCAWSPSARHASCRRLQARPSHAATNFDLSDLTEAFAGMSEMRSDIAAMRQRPVAIEGRGILKTSVAQDGGPDLSHSGISSRMRRRNRGRQR